MSAISDYCFHSNPLISWSVSNTASAQRAWCFHLDDQQWQAHRLCTCTLQRYPVLQHWAGTREGMWKSQDHLPQGAGDKDEKNAVCSVFHQILSLKSICLHVFLRFLARKVLDLQAGQSSPRLRFIYGLDWIDNAKTTWVAFQMDLKKTSCPKDPACHFHHQSASSTWVRPCSLPWLTSSKIYILCIFSFLTKKKRKILNSLFCTGIQWNRSSSLESTCTRLGACLRPIALVCQIPSPESSSQLKVKSPRLAC